MWPWCQRALTEAEWLRWAGANSLFRIDWWICAFSKPTWATFISCFMYRIETTCGWVRHIRSCLKPKMPKAQRYQMRSFWKMRSRDAVATTACLNGCWDRWEVAKTGPQLPTKPEILLIFICKIRHPIFGYPNFQQRSLVTLGQTSLALAMGIP